MLMAVASVRGVIVRSVETFVVRIFSARCFGVYDSGVAKRGSATLVRDVTHGPQNLWPGGFAAPHEGQLEASGAAH